MPHEKIEEDDAEGLRTKKFKFFRSANEPKKNRFLYNIESDEFENENIIQTSPEIVKNLEETLEKIKSESNIEFDDDISDEETKKIEGELKRLGYI